MISFIIAYIYLILSPKLLRRIKKTKVVLPAILFCSIVFFTVQKTDQLFDISFNKLRYVSFFNNPNAYGIEGRYSVWKLGVEKYLYSPIFGTGIANATNAKNAKLGLTGTVKGFYSPHNEYINLLLTTGIIGFFLYLLLFITILKKVNIILKNNTDDYSVFIAKSIKSIIIALAVFNMAVGFWDNSYIPALLMLLFGAMYAVDSASYRILSNYTIRSV